MARNAGTRRQSVTAVPRLATSDTDMQEVKDVSGGFGSRFEVLVVFSQFEGKPLLQRHR